jgi:hypothetical protein
MGATRNTGYLENLIQYDASDNVAIATSVNPSYKVTLGGSLLGTSAVFSSSVTSQVPNNTSVPQFSCVQTGGNTYGVIGINRNDGTGIATGLSSALVIRSGNATDYPIQFATANNIRLTIASNGAATFASSVTAGGLLSVNGDASLVANFNYASNGTYVRWQNNGTSFGDIGSGSTLVSGGSTNDFAIHARSTYNILFATNFTERLRINSAGDMELKGRATNATYSMYFYSDDSTSRIYSSGSSAVNKDIVLYTQGNPRMTITSGGNVLIGKTTNAGGRLQVSNGTNTFNVDHNADGPYLTGATDNNVNYRRLSYDATEHVFLTSATERMRIKSDGQLLMDQAGGNSWKLYINQQSNLGGENGIYVRSGYYPGIHLDGYAGVSGGGKWVINTFATGYGSGSLAGAMLLQSDRTLQFSTNGDNIAMTITTGQDVAIGDTTSESYRLKVRKNDYGLFVAAGSTTTHSIFVVQDASQASTYFRIRGGDGLMFSVPTYNNTTSSAANITIFSDGSMFRSTASSIRFKENITDWNANGLNTILALKPKTFTYKQDYYKHPEKVMLGLIAEEVAEVCPYLADYENEDGSGNVENVRYANIVVPLIKAIQELNQKIQALENR